MSHLHTSPCQILFVAEHQRLFIFADFSNQLHFVTFSIWFHIHQQQAVRQSNELCLFTLHRNGSGTVQRTGPAQQETMVPGSFLCLEPMRTFLYNIFIIRTHCSQSRCLYLSLFRSRAVLIAITGYTTTLMVTMVNQFLVKVILSSRKEFHC